jgi:hypothetical protein
VWEWGCRGHSPLIQGKGRHAADAVLTQSGLLFGVGEGLVGLVLYEILAIVELILGGVTVKMNHQCG